MVWCGVVWCSVVWWGVVWCSMIIRYSSTTDRSLPHRMQRQSSSCFQGFFQFSPLIHPFLHPFIHLLFYFPIFSSIDLIGFSPNFLFHKVTHSKSTRPSIVSFIQSLAFSPIHSLPIYPPLHPPIHPLIHPPIHLSTHPPIHPLIYPPICSSTHPSISPS